MAINSIPHASHHCIEASGIFITRVHQVAEKTHLSANLMETFFARHKFWIVISAILLVAIGAIVYLVRQNAQQERENKASMAEYRTRAEAYALKRGQELGVQQAQQMIQEYLKRPGSRHDLGDPGILPDLGCVSDWETNTSQRCAPNNTAITTEITQIGSTAPPPIDGPGSVCLEPANANDDFQGQVEAPMPQVTSRGG